MKTWIAAGLIILPLLIAGAIAYWPSDRPPVSSIIIPPPDIHSRVDVSNLAQKVPVAFANELKRIPRLRVETADTNIDANIASRFDAVIITTLTEDSGIIQLNVRAVSPMTRKEIWSGAFQSSRSEFPEMLRVAGESVKKAFD